MRRGSERERAILPVNLKLTPFIACLYVWSLLPSRGGLTSSRDWRELTLYCPEVIGKEGTRMKLKTFEKFASIQTKHCRDFRSMISLFIILNLWQTSTKKNKETDKENLFIMLYWKYELVNCVGFNGFCLGVAVSIHFDQIIKNGL